MRSATCGAEEQAGVYASSGVQADRVANDIPQELRALLSNARGHAHRRDAPRLRHQDIAGAALAPLDGLSSPQQMSACHVWLTQVQGRICHISSSLYSTTKSIR